MGRVKHLNPRQGITTVPKELVPREVNRCETPKSPPGDYNRCAAARAAGVGRTGVKHLNPRQGITTANDAASASYCASVPCETPKSPPGDYNVEDAEIAKALDEMCETPKSPPGDYNFSRTCTINPNATQQCETPKSPPGDYNTLRRFFQIAVSED